MADVRPFRGFRYGAKLVPDMGQVLAQPFDVISELEQQELYEQSPYNIVRLELPKGVNRYQEAALTLAEWIGGQVLVRDPIPAYYLTTHQFHFEGIGYVRTEITAALRVESYETGSVRPHEATRSGPKEDRLQLMQTAKMNMSPIMLLYASSKDITSILQDAQFREPDMIAEAFGETFTTHILSDSRITDRIQQMFRNVELYIADGHHRYETALAYSKALGKSDSDEACNFIMVTLVDFQDPGLLSLPYHRLLRGLSDVQYAQLQGLIQNTFILKNRSTKGKTAGEIATMALDELSGKHVVFTVWGLVPNMLTILSLEDAGMPEMGVGEQNKSVGLASLGASLFRELVLLPLFGCEEEEAEEQGLLTFGKNAIEAVEGTNSGKYQVVFMPRSVSVETLKALSDRSEKLPPKATYFHPKLATGIVIKSLEASL